MSQPLTLFIQIKPRLMKIPQAEKIIKHLILEMKKGRVLVLGK